MVIVYSGTIYLRERSCCSVLAMHSAVRLQSTALAAWLLHKTEMRVDEVSLHDQALSSAGCADGRERTEQRRLRAHHDCAAD